MARAHTYSEAQLLDAVGASISWRGVLRELGLRGTSAGALRSVRKRADECGIDYGHFRGQRRWTEAALGEALEASRSWSGVADFLGLGDPEEVTQLKGHAHRLGMDSSHIDESPSVKVTQNTPHDALNLARAGSLLAAGWYTLQGLEVSWPLEPCRYDLLVDAGAAIHRVQVKTTNARAGSSWKVYISTSGGKRKTYDVDEIDEFFIVDGDLSFYRIPVQDVGGLQALHLKAYQRYRLARWGRSHSDLG